MLFSSFISGAYTDRCPLANAEALVNLSVAPIDSQSSPKRMALRHTPGLKPLLFVVPQQGCRGLWSADGRTFAVIGDALYELDVPAATATYRGQIAPDTAPVSFASNGRGGEQLAIVGGGELKIFDLQTNTFSAAVSLPLTNRPHSICFLDGYFLLLEQDTPKMYFSALEDGLTWDALDFAARSTVSDNLVGLAVVNDRIWTLGSQRVELFYDSGDADTPFVPYPGTVSPFGCVSPYGVTERGGTLFWVAMTGNGTPQIVAATAGAPQVISTPAVDFALASYPTVSDVEAFSYTQEGEDVVIFTFPSGGESGVTWAYSPKIGQWSQRAHWNSALGQFERWSGRGCCGVGNTILVGDYQTGDVYTLDLETFTDNGQTIRRVRRAPYFANDPGWIFLDTFELGAQVGLGLATGQGSDPQAQLMISRDGANTWNSAGFASLGAMGQYDSRTVWRRLGRARADRLVLELVITDPIPITVLGAWVTASSGT